MSRSRKQHRRRQEKEKAAIKGTTEPVRSEADTGEGDRARTRTSKWPVLKAVAIFVGVMGGFYAIDYYTPLLTGDGIESYLSWIARSAAAILTLLGHEASTNGTSIVSSEFAVRVVRGCDALDPTVAFVAAVLASPVSFKLKLPGLVAGIISLLLINIVRIVTLFFVGVHFRKIFDMMHYEFWQAAFIALAIAFWAVWVQWATRRPGRIDDVAS